MYGNPLNWSGRRENSIENPADLGAGSGVKVLVASLLLLGLILAGVVWLIEASF